MRLTRPGRRWRQAGLRRRHHRHQPHRAALCRPRLQLIYATQKSARGGVLEAERRGHGTELDCSSSRSLRRSQAVACPTCCFTDGKNGGLAGGTNLLDLRTSLTDDGRASSSRGTHTSTWNRNATLLYWTLHAVVSSKAMYISSRHTHDDRSGAEHAHGHRRNAAVVLAEEQSGHLERG